MPPLGRGGTGRRAPCEAAAAPAVDRLFWPVIRWKRGFYCCFALIPGIARLPDTVRQASAKASPGRCHAGPGQRARRRISRKAEETPSATLPETTAEPQAIVAESAARDVIVESDYIRALFSNRGGELKSWTLNRFADDHGRPVDLVPTGAPAAEPRSFALIADDAALTNRLGGALYRASTDRARVGTNGGQLVFEYQDASGLQIRKQFDFQVAGNPYLVGLTAQVTVNGAPVRTSVSSGPGLGDTDRATGGSAFSPTYYQKPQGIYFLDGKVTRLPEPTLLKQPRVEGHYKFIGVDDHYFLSSILPGRRNTQVDYRVIRIETAAGPRELVAYTRAWLGLRDARSISGPKLRCPRSGGPRPDTRHQFRHLRVARGPVLRS